MKLFGLMQAQEPDALMRNKKYTRFAHEHTREQAEQPTVTSKQPCQTAPVTPKRPKAQPEPEQPAPQPISLADQLHSESDISIALLRRALPSRFAEIDARTRRLAKESVADLQFGTS